MTDTTKRPDVGELLRERLAQLQDGGCKKLTVEQVIGLIGFCEFEAAPQADGTASDIADALERSTQSMARECKVGMGLWNGHSNACLNAIALLRKAVVSPAPQPPVEGLREALEWVRSEIFALCEATEDSARDGQDFSRGRCFEAKGIRRAIGEVIRDRLATVTSEPELWRHKKRGTVYRILHNNITMQEEQTEGRRLDDEPMVVYQDVKSGAVYVRLVVEMWDGRFEQVAPLASPSPSLSAAPVGEPETLPCDVRLPPATTIRKGCKVSTLILAIKQRESYADADTRFAAPVGENNAEELRMLRERLGPRGLEVIEIDGRGHYVNEAVKAEIVKLRADHGYDHGYADGVEWAVTKAAPVAQEPVAFINRDVLKELQKHKTATGTVSSALLKKPFAGNVALYAAAPSAPSAPPAPPASARVSAEEIARIIDPDAFEKWDQAEGSWRKDEARARCWPAEEKANAILALIRAAEGK